MNSKIRALLGADVIWFFGEGLLGPLFAVFTERIGGDVLDITWAWATYLIVTGILIVVVGKLSDTKISKEKLIFAGYFLNAILTFMYLFVGSPVQLLILQAGLGIAAALATPTWDALYAKHEDRKSAGLTWGLADGMSEFFSGVAILLGGFIVVYWSFSALFIIMGCIQIIALISLLPALRKDNKPKR